jgi:drug/metabolite transporter (DMT)-like permease
VPEPRALLGVSLVVGMAAAFAAMDTSVRALAGVFPVLLMLWLRYAMQAAVMAVWLALRRGPGFRAEHPRFQVLRGMLLLFTSAMIFFGLLHLPVPELTAINMLAPLLVTLLAGWLLHERVSRLRWALVAGGLAGALLVVRPGTGLFGAAALFPLAGAVSYAAFQVLTSRMSALDSPYTTHFWTGMVGMLIATPLLGTGGHLLLILALGMAPTSTLMPFVYAQIPIATLFSAAAFGTAPDAAAWIGMALIMACGASAAWLNLRGVSARGEAAVAE